MGRGLFIYEPDHTRHDHHIEVGRVEWNVVHQDYKITWYGQGEVPPLVKLVIDKIDFWLDGNRLPYCQEDLKPWQTGFWVHIQKLLIHQTRLYLLPQ